MTTIARSRKATANKTVQVLARYQFKDDARKVVYLVKSSDGATQYYTYLYNGKATGCDCPAHKPCYHMTGCEAAEAKRGYAVRAEALATAVMTRGIDVVEAERKAARAVALSEARQQAEQMLAVIDAQVIEDIVSASTQPQIRPLSEQARFANIDDDDLEEIIDPDTRYTAYRNFELGIEGLGSID